MTRTQHRNNRIKNQHNANAAKTARKAERKAQRESDKSFLGALETPARSICTCSHTGDGTYSQHYGVIGHGPCAVPGCKCIKFTWQRFI